METISQQRNEILSIIAKIGDPIHLQQATNGDFVNALEKWESFIHQLYWQHDFLAFLNDIKQDPHHHEEFSDFLVLHNMLMDYIWKKPLQTERVSLPFPLWEELAAEAEELCNRLPADEEAPHNIAENS
ncbi:MAG: hypothetical protein CMF31_03955 [Kordiimonas sp.]|nr:hypothetical protein [Kordiimonas sp.]|tara:strand:+ start:202 stop:588 length:387 start_codon:yes stop_codon:yes gene_type:complete